MTDDASMPLEVSVQDVNRWRESAQELTLLDCREPDEYSTARIDGAKLLPMSELAARIGELSKLQNSRIVVHCHHGGRSLRVVRWLREQGFGQAQSMAGGIDQWSLEIDPNVPRY